jgi:hypothetical protein
VRFCTNPTTYYHPGKEAEMSKEITAQERQRRASLAFRVWWEKALRKAEERRFVRDERRAG